jgi:hypothetical protein
VFSLVTIHKVLSAAKVKPLAKPRRPLHPKRYSRPIPGDRVQMDTMKIAPGVYQFTAVDAGPDRLVHASVAAIANQKNLCIMEASHKGEVPPACTCSVVCGIHRLDQVAASGGQART